MRVATFVLAVTMLVLPGVTQAAEDRVAEVRAALAKLGEAFNKHDAAAIAAAWTEDGILVDTAGGQWSSRKEIEAHYVEEFKDEPDLKLTAKLSAIEIEGDSRAFVRGTAEVAGANVDGNNESSSSTSFVAELVREVDPKSKKAQWLLVSVEESDPDPLDDLAWLVGRWQDEGDERKIRTLFYWDTGGRFLIRKFTIENDDGVQRTGTEYIGWDAARSELRSWLFDSTGTMGEGRWLQHDDHWAVHWTGTLTSGGQATATQIIKPIDEDSFTVQWSDIDVEGEFRPSTSPVTVRRDTSSDGNAGKQTGGAK